MQACLVSREGWVNAERVPAPVLVVAAAVSVQCGAAVAFKLFTDVGPLGAVWIRLLLSAAIMMALARPALRSAEPRALRTAVVFGVVLAAMNTAFYFSLSRVPLGAAVTVEFIGPLAVAVAGSRRLADLLWVVLAALGVVLLAGAGDSGTGQLDPVGLLLAAVAGACWAGYILLAKRVGVHFPGTSGLTIALVVGAVALAPAALVRHGAGFLDAGVLAGGLVVALLSSALPYSLELIALRRLRPATFGVLLSLDPAVAALSGLLILGQHLEWTEWVAIGCVVLASAGASLTAPASAGPLAADPPQVDRAVVPAGDGS